MQVTNMASRSGWLGLALILTAVGPSTNDAAMAAQPDAAPREKTTVVHAGQLLAVPGEKVLTRKSVVITRGRIDAIENGFLSPDDFPGRDDVEFVDLSDSFVLPGLIDAHDHITHKPGRNKREWITTVSDSLRALHGAHYAKLTLEAGFTSVRNVGSVGEAIFALRDAIDRGLVPGPRLQAAGNFISTTGGHGDRSTGFRQDLFPITDHSGVCDGADECRKAVRRQIKNGADLIKVMVTGGVNSEASTGVGQHFSDAELAAMVDAAHSLGRKIAGHAHAAAGVNAALRAGFDSIEHGAFLDDESIRLFKKTGAFLVPTLSVGDHVLAIANDPDSPMSEAVRVKARVAIPTMMDNVEKAYAAGVNIAFGTDSGEPEHGRNADEFLFLRQIGMTSSDAIQAATVNAAELMGLADEIGSLEPGKAADLIATKGSPLADISELQRVTFVMKGGTVYKGP